jgi:hypothetical protein
MPNPNENNLKNKLKNRINELKNKRNSNLSNENYLKEIKVPENLIHPILNFFNKYKKYPFDFDFLKKLKELPDDEVNKIISSLDNIK